MHISIICKLHLQKFLFEFLLIKKKKKKLVWVEYIMQLANFAPKHLSMPTTFLWSIIYLFLWKVWRHLSDICNTYSTSFIKGLRFDVITIQHMQYIVYIIHYWIAIRCNNQLTFLRTKIQSLCTIKQVSFVARVCDE